MCTCHNQRILSLKRGHPQQISTVNLLHIKAGDNELRARGRVPEPSRADEASLGNRPVRPILFLIRRSSAAPSGRVKTDGPQGKCKMEVRREKSDVDADDEGKGGAVKLQLQPSLLPLPGQFGRREGRRQHCSRGDLLRAALGPCSDAIRLSQHPRAVQPIAQYSPSMPMTLCQGSSSGRSASSSESVDMLSWFRYRI